tara:strand:- start:228 stop:1037 length:810 start_codon:yes stop_codon:yes gene_type:complete
MSTGSDSGTWGTNTNYNLQKLEYALKGYSALAVASTTQALVTVNGGDGSTDIQSRAIIKFTGNLDSVGGSSTVTCEAFSNWYIIEDATTSSINGYTLSFGPSGGTPVVLTRGAKQLIYTDGSTAYDVIADTGNILANGKLDVTGGTSKFDGGNVTVNDAAGDYDFRVEGSSDPNNFVSDAGDNRIGIGVLSPQSAKLEVNQSGSTAAIAVINLDQDDADQEFIYFDGTSAADSTASLSSSTASAGGKQGAIRVSINGTDRWIRFYDSAV